MSHHLCLVSAQPMPNYLPIVKPEIRPEKVTLAVTNEMRDRACYLRRELNRHNIMVEELPLDVDATSFDMVQQRIMEWMEAHVDEEIVLNVTGGTKPMAIAAQEVFRMAGKPVFYVDVDTDKVWWLDSSQRNPKWTVRCIIDNPVQTTTYLNLHGLSLIEGQQAFDNPYWMELARELALEASSLGETVGRLNYLAADAEARNSLDGRGLEFADKKWTDLLEKLFWNEITTDRQRLVFRSAQARSFANGGWLEAYLFDKIKEIIPNRETTFMNAKLAGVKGEENEIDVLTISRNQLFAFECKTRNFSKSNSASDALYKLSAIQRGIKGIRTKGVMVSFRPINPEDKRRADSYDIQCIGPNELHSQHIKGILTRILRNE